MSIFKRRAAHESPPGSSHAVPDTAVGGKGNDVLRAIDGIDGNDTVYGGPGADTCFVDAGDATKGCEDIRVPA